VCEAKYLVCGFPCISQPVLCLLVSLVKLGLFCFFVSCETIWVTGLKLWQYPKAQLLRLDLCNQSYTGFPCVCWHGAGVRLRKGKWFFTKYSVDFLEIVST